jgi:hypothetical protein
MADRYQDAISRHSVAYNLFILVLTEFSLLVMVLMLLPVDEDTYALLQFYDIIICIIFMIGFFLNLKTALGKSRYFFKKRGWLDVLSSMPALGTTMRFSGLLRSEAFPEGGKAGCQSCT